MCTCGTEAYNSHNLNFAHEQLLIRYNMVLVEKNIKFWMLHVSTMLFLNLKSYKNYMAVWCKKDIFINVWEILFEYHYNETYKNTWKLPVWTPMDLNKTYDSSKKVIYETNTFFF